jgi:hypothetical protein
MSWASQKKESDLVGKVIYRGKRRKHMAWIVDVKNTLKQRKVPSTERPRASSRTYSTLGKCVSIVLLER